MKRKFAGKRLFKDRLKEELKNPAFRKEYNKADASVRLAIRIAKLREEEGLSQKDLAEKLGTQQQVISRIESSGEANLTLSTLQKIAAALHRRLIIDLK